MKPTSIRLFIKPACGWCHEVMEWLDAKGIQHERLNVSANPALYQEMIQLSGQRLAPVIDVDGEILADFGADELQVWWKEMGFQPS